MCSLISPNAGLAAGWADLPPTCGSQCCVRVLYSSYGALPGSSHAAGVGKLLEVCASLS